MFGLFKKTSQKRYFDRRTLRKNDISLLTLDERWNSLFASAQKTPEIVKTEEELKELLKEQSRLFAERKEITVRKKGLMDRIMQLTTEAFDKNSEQAKNEMQLCEKEIKRINDRLGKIEEEIESVPERIRDKNLELLEHTVNYVYFGMRSNQKRVEELDKLIEETKEKLMKYIDEKESLSQGNSDTYSYFHDLLGGEELEKLDKEFFG